MPPRGQSRVPKPQPIEEQEYFHGFLPREDLPQLLVENGDFLVRTSEVNNGARQYIVSMMLDKGRGGDNEMKHFVINKVKGKYKLEAQAFNSIPELINYYLGKKEPLTSAMPNTILKNAAIRQNWELLHDDIQLLKKLGEGAFGEVHSGKLKLKTRRTVDVAVKLAKVEQMNKEKVKELMKEARLMRNYDHPNVVKLYGVAVEQEPLMIVMELVNGGALDDYLRKNTVQLSEKMDSMCLGSAWGLEYLHNKNCLHRDVAARNCLYAKGVVKISDFGLSHEGQSYQMTSGKRLPIKWLAPETLDTGIYTQRSDVFSYGIMVWEIFSNGTEPYNDMVNAEVQKKVLEGYRMEMAPETPEEVVQLITKHCWDMQDTRWTMSMVARELERITGLPPPPQNRPKKDKAAMTQDATIERTVDQRTVEENVTNTKMAPSAETIIKPKEKSKEPIKIREKERGKKKEQPKSRAKSTVKKASRRRATRQR